MDESAEAMEEESEVDESGEGTEEESEVDESAEATEEEPEVDEPAEATEEEPEVDESAETAEEESEGDESAEEESEHDESAEAMEEESEVDETAEATEEEGKVDESGEATEKESEGDESAEAMEEESEVDESAETAEGEAEGDESDSESAEESEGETSDEEVDGEETAESTDDMTDGGENDEAVGSVRPQRQFVTAYTRYAATVDLAEVETFPIFLDALMAQAAVVSVEETAAPVDAEASESEESVSGEMPAEIEVEPEVDEEDTGSTGDGMTEQIDGDTAEVVESEPIEPMQSEAVVELGGGEESTEAVEAPAESDAETDDPEWIIDYDHSLIAVERTEAGYVLSVIDSFEKTVVTINTGDLYAITLLNGALESRFPETSFSASTEHVVVNVEAPEGAFPEGTTMVVADVDDEDTISSITEKVEEGFVRVERVHAVDITFLDAEGAEIEPRIPIAVTMSVREIEEQKEAVVVHVDHEGEAQVVENTSAVTEENVTAAPENEIPPETAAETPAPEPDAAEAMGSSVAFTAESFSVYAVVVGEKLETKAIDADGNTYHIEVIYSNEANIPAGSRLEAEEVTDEDWLDRAQASLEDGRKVVMGRFFDIRIMNGEEEVQPSVPVMVRVELVNDEETDLTAATPCAVHFAGDAPDVVNASKTDDAVTFRADGFSVWGVVYTVDFHYEVNGRSYTFNLSGGGFVRLSDLVMALGIGEPVEAAEEALETESDSVEEYVEETEFDLNDSFDAEAAAGPSVEETPANAERTWQFLNNVESVVFSDARLVWVGKLENAATVGEIKAENGLECQYTAEMTEEEVNSIDAQSVEADDWVLISLLPFDTEESLTVTMKNGDVFTVKVTDAKINTLSQIKDNQPCVIYWNYGNKYYVMGHDLSVKAIDATESALNALSSEYLWTFQNTGNTYRGYSNTKEVIVNSFGADKEYQLQLYNGLRVVEKGPWDNTLLLWHHDDNRFGFFGWDNPTSRIAIEWSNPAKFVGKRDGNENKLNIWKPDENIFGVGVNDEDWGTVSGKNRDGADVSPTNFFYTTTFGASQNYTNKYAIDAIAKPGYVFDHWELNDSSSGLESYGAHIDANALRVQNEYSVLKAVFAKVSSQTVLDFPPLDTPSDVNWVLEAGDPLSNVDKTAEVYDYENRIYRVDLKASTGLKVIGQDLALAFVTDISNSMLFPERLNEVKYYGSNVSFWSNGISQNNSLHNQLEQLANSGKISRNEVYIAIGDKAQSSTQYAIWYAHGNAYYDGQGGEWIGTNGNNVNNRIFFPEGWYALDASYYARWKANAQAYSDMISGGSHRTKALKSTYFLHSNEKESDSYEYIVYQPNSNWFAGFTSTDTLYCHDENASTFHNRLSSLVTSLKAAIEQVKDMADEYPLGAVYAGLETFAGSTKTDVNTIVKETVGEDSEWDALHQKFVQIAGGTNYGTTNFDDNLDAIFYKATHLTTRDGTAQDIAIQKLNDILNWSRVHDVSNAKKVVVMITDGAPNRRNSNGDTKPIDEIISAINAEKTNGTLKNATLVTVGLGINDVEGGRKLLHEIATLNEDGDPMFYSARTGTDLVYILADIIRTVMGDAAVKATVTDVVDEAFYPVNPETGKPIALTEGKGYIGLDGKELPAKPTDNSSYGEITYDAVTDRYTITWHSQDVKPIIKPAKEGWHGTVFIKSKEDFLGGNTIKTNNAAALNPEHYYLVDKNGNRKKDTSGNDLPDFPVPEDKKQPVCPPTPHVNVDELALTQNETEWTVYLDREIDSLDELKALYKEIQVKEVVDKSVEEKHKINDGNTSYQISPNSTIDNTEPTGAQERFLLSTVSSALDAEALDWKKLIEEGELPLIPYSAYGHDAGNIKIELVKETAENANDAEDDLTDGSHKTNVIGEAVEKYTLRVTYIPKPYDPTANYHTGNYGSGKSGNLTNESYSINGHVVNVFAKSLEVYKRNEDYNRQLTGAKFAMYRTWREGDGEENKVTLHGVDGDFFIEYPEAPVDDAGKLTFENLMPLGTDEKRYLVETVAPAGYNLLPSPLEIILTVVENYRPVPPKAEDGWVSELPTEIPYDWEQKASLVLNGSSNVMTNETGVNPNTLNETEKAALLATVTPNAENGKVYYLIANNPGVSLPATGGPGTALYTVSGIALIALAVILLLRKKEGDML